MVACTHCELEMLTADGCSVAFVEFKDGERRKSVLHGYEPVWRESHIPLPERCHDCGAKPGFYHHPGCDMERCPRCGGQLIACGCGHAG